MAKPQRPELSKISSSEEFRQWYWLKAELVEYCREHKIPYSAGKFELIDRIAHFMDTGEIPQPKRKKTRSKFDWSSETLTPKTIITDNYKNSQNMRGFMQEQIGTHFRFNNDFMNWMRNNVGLTLADAIEAWLAIDARKKDENVQIDIPHHNQLNQYMRDFFDDNPDLSIKEARKCWEYRRSLPSPSGRHRYSKDDLVSLSE